MLNKFQKAFVKQNPAWEIKCPGCKKKIVLKTIELLSAKKTNVICPKCEAEIKITGLDEAMKKLETEMKKLGITAN